MSFLERIQPGLLLEQIRERRATSLPIFLITLLVLATVILTLVMLWPSWRQRQALVGELSVAQSIFEQQAQLPRPDRASLSNQVTTLRQELAKAQKNFISETEADAILNQIYENANISNITVDSLQAQATAGEEGEQLPQIAFRLKASGSPIQLLNFVARINQASVPGVKLDNLSLVPGESADIVILMMDIQFYTIPQILDPPTPASATAEPDTTATPTPTPDDPTSVD